MIRQYIEEEAHAVQAERENDVSDTDFRGNSNESSLQTPQSYGV